MHEVLLESKDVKSQLAKQPSAIDESLLSERPLFSRNPAKSLRRRHSISEAPIILRTCLLRWFFCPLVTISDGPKVQTWGIDKGYFGSRTKVNSSFRKPSSLDKAPVCYLFWKQDKSFRHFKGTQIH